MKTTYPFIVVIAAVALIAGCSGRIASSIAQECSDQLDLANAEMEKAKADGFGEALSMTKAASLLAAAAVQKQFERYDGCVDKAKRARAYIADAARK